MSAICLNHVPEETMYVNRAMCNDLGGERWQAGVGLNLTEAAIYYYVNTTYMTGVVGVGLSQKQHIIKGVIHGKGSSSSKYISDI